MMMKNSNRGGGGGGGGEIVQVQGGHILRSTGRKDRHSKVFTAKGPRDRRVRLSAHTAIQFYDVQDRLGYDRPSKAVDWLLKKAKNAIDKLAELPPWNPVDSTAAAAAGVGGSSEMTILGGHQSEFSSGYGLQLNHHQLGETPGADSSFQMNQSIQDPMKSFFPMTSQMNFHTQDLCLSLHSSTDQNQTLFQGSGPATFETNFPEPSWDGGGGGTGENREGYMFNPHQFFCQSSMGSERGPLQSSCSSPPAHAWMNHHQIQQPSSSISGGQFASPSLLQFQIPQQIHCSNEPSSVSPNDDSS